MKTIYSFELYVGFSRITYHKVDVVVVKTSHWPSQVNTQAKFRVI
jgi:hypothetical protein